MDVSFTILLSTLPYLIKRGDKAAEKATETAAKKFEESSWAKAQAILNQLHPKLKKESAKQAATDVAEHPKDRDLHSIVGAVKETPGAG